ncbi:hypothetical protein AUJ40_01830 [Candidatus Berkelbacteria bacterium CG1_02_42_45]|uniref:tRNA N6-adenosine threonylcarbamoyltransferase n=2 Tax=Candidatus Berkelbacteria TaxID=1618330 RepID=A0A2M7K1K9_9BACT|nr:MAG: hypothetical protein AUJ40_01830 [Candidatus Berkelbacteria bacterium CG1_02_42_45]PIX30120.1 MAG: tRNA (adenosine(37)-N6)-threonylcarbamoyltransferase complex transferase subunit TsaD [Candidatus Berkelbacteria bacterium CG_4_8_14_3_um_filter_42_13]
MKNENIKILAIETSCDETAVAIIDVEKGEPKVLSNIISSQANLHAKTGGVVPEVASRAHMHAIMPIIEEALLCANSKSEYRNPKQIRNSNDQNSKVLNLDIVSNLDISASDLLSQITHIAVTNGPGLIGSLLVGFNAAKTIAYAKKLPLIPVNHIEGHIYSAYAELNPKSECRNPKQTESNSNVSNLKNSNLDIVSTFDIRASDFPILALTVSGGHTSLNLIKDHLKYETIGETIDDAAGEAFDKVAKLLKLGYPGGPEVSRAAESYRKRIKNHESRIMGGNHDSEFIIHNSITFPRPLINKPNFNFSFSGLKTAVLTEVINRPAKTADRKQEICFAFEEAVVDVLCSKTIKAAKKYKPMGILLAGGVAADKRLQDELKYRIEKYNLGVEEKYRMNFYIPGPGMAGDNAAMIGIAAYYHILKNDLGNWRNAIVDANLSL